MSSKEGEKHIAVKTKAGPKKTTELAPWRPEDYWGEVDRYLGDFARRFDNPFWPFSGHWFAQRRAMMPELSQIRHPYTDLIDSGNEFRVMAEVPGIPKERLNVTVTEREIKIEGEAKTDVREEKEGFVRRERGYSRVFRTLSFPEPVVPAKAEASVNDGVLEVRIPKKTPTKVTRHKVAVK